MSLFSILEQEIIASVKEIFDYDCTPDEVHLSISGEEGRGDFSSNVALRISQKLGIPATQIAEELAKVVCEKNLVKNVDIAGGGFLNITCTDNALWAELAALLPKDSTFGISDSFEGRIEVVEFAHPNTHKEMHIGHMRTLVVGESISRILEINGATVFRANYQGDIGPHVAKSLWGLQYLLDKRQISISTIDERYSLIEKGRILGEAYVVGNKYYNENRSEIDNLNKALYKRDATVLDLYNTTRSWSLAYYDDFYKRFYTHFDKLYFESEVDYEAIKVVNSHLGTVFEADDSAIIFRGKEYGLHNRVFISSEGNPLYEAKDTALAFRQAKDFDPTRIIHVVGDEQRGYFEVVFKALSLIDPFVGSLEYHLPMGMVSLKGFKMSSRTGVVITIDGLLDEVSKEIQSRTNLSGLTLEEKNEIVEMIAVGAVKYSVLTMNPKKSVLLDKDQAVTLDGMSGPYIQYTIVRTNALLRKAKDIDYRKISFTEDFFLDKNIRALILLLLMYSHVVKQSAQNLEPNLIAEYAFKLAKSYSGFYSSKKIIGSEDKKYEALALLTTVAVSNVLTHSLNLLGIKSPDRM